jgi:serine phosphatase RsbU (regulator of sigma subunit)
LVGEIARRAALALDTARIYGERDETARILQQGLMPPALPTIEGADIAAGYWPATGELEVGGDFYDVFERGGDVFVAVGDVCGKGARAAALTGLARHTLRTASASERRPAVTLSILNQAVLEENIDDRFLTAVLCALRCGSDGIDVTLSRGGHPPPLLLRGDGTVEATGRPGTLIGVVEDPTFCDEQVLLAPGDALVLYTDGITEAPVSGGRFGEERLAQVIAGCAGLEASAISDRVERAALRQAGYARSDDAVVLVIRAT